MDYCHKCGIKLIVCDKRSRWSGAATDPEKYKKEFQKAYKDFGKHKATWGFYIGDEPDLPQADDVVKAYEIQLEVAPELIPFVNYLPFWHPSIEEIADAIFPRIQVKHLSYDYYAQMVKGNSPEGYFKQLRRWGEESKKYGVDFWATILSTSHWAYEINNKDDYVWQLNTAVASGSKGILWFHFYTDRALNNYRNAPINKLGERSFTYPYISETNREFHLLYGDYFSRLRLVESYHTVEAYGGFPLFNEGDSDVVLKVEDVKNNCPLIISFFKDEKGEDYFAVVNNSRTEVARVSLTISSDAGKIIHLGRNATITPTKITQALAVGGDVEREDDDKIPNSYENLSWHAPGQLNLYKIEK